jgi:hypothetical protein
MNNSLRLACTGRVRPAALIQVFPLMAPCDPSKAG